jgi:hypothetical protein
LLRQTVGIGIERAALDPMDRDSEFDTTPYNPKTRA